MRKEINEFLEADFKFRLQEWSNLWEEYNSTSSTNETYLKLMHLEELFKTAARYKFPQYDNTNEMINNYLTYLESQI